MSQRGVPTAAARAIVAERGAKQRGPRRRALATLAALIDTSISAQHTRVHYVTRSGATKRMYVSKTSWADLQDAQELVVTAAR